MLSPWPAPTGSQRAYHAMAKPIGSLCNLDCTYCYYLHKKDLLGTANNFRISDEILETHIRQYIEGQDRREVVFSWQGGEPTLLGLDFFRKVVELEQKYKKPNQRIENDLQTNGTLLNEEWGSFLKKHGFLVGLSIDGPKELHDRYRVAKDGKPTFEKVFAAAQMLHRHGVPFNVLCVVNRMNAKQPLDVYRFLKNEIRPRQIQCIPCVEPKEYKRVAPHKWDPTTLPLQGSPSSHPGNPDSIVTDWSVDPDDWGYFLCKVWDDWYRRDLGKVFINHFESAVAQWRGWTRRCAFTTTSAAKVWLWSTTATSIRATTMSIRNTSSATSLRLQVPGWFSPSSSARLGSKSPAHYLVSASSAVSFLHVMESVRRIAPYGLARVNWG
jgi:serine-type anaerobic sulfatase-maturating enzyme